MDPLRSIFINEFTSLEPVQADGRPEVPRLDQYNAYTDRKHAERCLWLRHSEPVGTSSPKSPGKDKTTYEVQRT